MPGPDDLPSLTDEELLRYGRHLVLPEVGLEGQRRLKQARVLLVGAGGLGSPAALYLAAAGLGHLGLCDFDAVDASNLQRQVLHGWRDVGRPKVESARDRIADLNPNVQVELHPVRLDRGNALELVRAHDLVVDGTDNFATRYLVNDACVLPGLLGLIQATEALKLLLGIGEPLIGRLLLVDALTMRFQSLRLKRDPSCPACGTRTLRELPDHEAFCAGPAAAHLDGVAEFTPSELAARLAAGPPVELVDVRERHEWAVTRLPGARLAPLSELETHLATLPRDRDLVLYCRVGQRSATAGRLLQAAGFTRIWHLAGGLLRWTAERGPPQDPWRGGGAR
jgi:sulfur-carrier protein adenylyltransferase/sulfurtransferase